MELIHEEMSAVLADLHSSFPLDEKKLLVLGVSTSEVLGERIGSHGSDRVAETIYTAVVRFQQQHGFMLAFQCCEHLNRALVVSRETANFFRLTEVTAIPVPHAGGAMAAYAFRHLPNATLVESIAADAGIDIGSTLIGMHLKQVAIPLRPLSSHIGEAYVTMAMTRPKLIGGARAVYVKQD